MTKRFLKSLLVLSLVTISTIAATWLSLGCCDILISNDKQPYVALGWIAKLFTVFGGFTVLLHEIMMLYILITSYYSDRKDVDIND
jgi:small basic protein